MTDRQVDTELLCIKMTTGTEQEELILYIYGTTIITTTITVHQGGRDRRKVKRN